MAATINEAVEFRELWPSHNIHGPCIEIQLSKSIHRSWLQYYMGSLLHFVGKLLC